VDGRIVVNQQSLTVQAQEREEYTRVVTEDSARLNSLSYMNRISNERWTLEDTELFYKVTEVPSSGLAGAEALGFCAAWGSPQNGHSVPPPCPARSLASIHCRPDLFPPLMPQALSQFGTDFTLITNLFPGRQRRHLKNKYTRESKINGARVDEALRASQHTTITSYQEMIALLKQSGMNLGGAGPALGGDAADDTAGAAAAAAAAAAALQVPAARSAAAAPAAAEDSGGAGPSQPPGSGEGQDGAGAGLTADAKAKAQLRARLAASARGKGKAAKGKAPAPAPAPARGRRAGKAPADDAGEEWTDDADAIFGVIREEPFEY
jgi:hypothetical protein